MILLMYLPNYVLRFIDFSKAGTKVQKKNNIHKKNLHISKKSSTFAADFVI